MHALRAHAQAQPGGLDLLRHLFAGAQSFGFGLVLQTQALFFLGAAPAAGVQRHRELHAHHGAQVLVLRRAVGTTAVQALLPGLGNEVHAGRGTQAVLARLGAGCFGGQRLQADTRIAVLGLLLPGFHRELPCKKLHSRSLK